MNPASVSGKGLHQLWSSKGAQPRIRLPKRFLQLTTNNCILRPANSAQDRQHADDELHH